MAKEKIRGDTPLPPNLPIRDNQMSDILLIMDKMELVLHSLSEIDKNGKAKLVPAKEENENSFLKFDKHSNFLENFLKNFWSQYNDPTRFHLFKLNFKQYKENREAVKEIAEGKETDRVKEFLKKYEIRPKEIKQENDNHKKETVMAKQDQTSQAATTNQPTNEAPKYRYNESLINWDQLGKFGLSKNRLEEQGLLEPLLKGYKTNRTVPIEMNFGSAVLRTDARLSFQQSLGGQVVLAIHGVRKEPDLDKAFFGHVFTPEDKENLKKTGNLGRVVELTSRYGENVPSFVSIDKLTNELVAMKADMVSIPEKIKGVELTKEDIADLKAGKPLYLEGMKANSGKDFNATVQVNADRRGIEFSFNNDGLNNKVILGGVELKGDLLKGYNDGKAVLVENMQTNDKTRTFDSFVKLDPATARPQFYSYNPDSPEGARQIIIPKEILGVQLEPEDRKQLAKGDPVFLYGMQNKSGETFDSYVKLNTNTGSRMFSKTLDGFSEREQVKIPHEIMGVPLTSKQRADLQDGKATLVSGIQGYDGKLIDQWAKASPQTGKVNLFDENPDKVKNAVQRNVIEDRKEKIEENKQNSKKRKTQGEGIGADQKKSTDQSQKSSRKKTGLNV